MRALLVIVLLSALSACAGGDEDPRGPTTITTERSDTSTYGLLAEETTCADFVAMSESERLTTLKNIDSVKNIEHPGSSLETFAGVITDVCGLDGSDLADVGLDSVLVNYR